MTAGAYPQWVRQIIAEKDAVIEHVDQQLAYMTSEANRLNREIEDLKTQNHRLQDQISRREW